MREPGRWRCPGVIVLCLLLGSALPAAAQDPGPEVTEPPAQEPVTAHRLRAALYRSVRQAKREAVLTDSLVDEPGRANRLLTRLEGRLRGGGTSWYRELGFTPVTGGLRPGAGFTLGLQYDPLWRRPGVVLNASVRGSTRRYWSVEGAAGYAGRLAGYGYARYRHMPQEDFFGFGMETEKDGRTDYRRDEAMGGGLAVVELLPNLIVGGHASYMTNRLGAGTDELLPDLPDVFEAGEVPGLIDELDYTIVGGFVEFERGFEAVDDPYGRRYLPARQELRGISSSARRGVYFVADFDRYLPANGAPYGFTRLDVESQQFIPLRHGFQVLALRELFAFTEADEGEAVPFFLMPSLGGINTLRGFNTFRFTDANAALLTAEFRYQVWLMMDVALFADAGQVFATRDAFSLSEMEMSYGLGLRFRGRADSGGPSPLMGRFDVAFSSEGVATYLKLGAFF